MYIRRKVFSVLLDENGEERLFSTTEFVDEETYLNQKEFGEKKLSTSDKIDFAVGKLIPKKIAERQARYWDMENEEDSKAAAKEARKRSFKGLTAGGAIAGALSGAAIGRKGSRGRGAAIGTIAGAGAGAVLGGVGALSHKLGEKTARALHKNSDKYKKYAKKGSDKYKVISGQMSKEEYTEKHGKEKK